MTIKIKASELGSWTGMLSSTEEGFAEQVRLHAAAMEEYAAHLRGVEADAANEALAPEERRVAFPPPTSHPLVEMAVKEGYEIVGPSLAEKKAALFAEVRRMESEALQAIIPPAKARHWAFREQDIRAADQAFLAENPGVSDPAALLNARRSEDDRQFLRDQADRKAREQSAMRSAARLEYSIDNLTEETIDGWSADMSEAFK